MPWDVKYTRSGRLLITERSGRLFTWRLGKLRQVSFPASTVWAQGETGLMSLAIDPGYESNRRFYTCQGSPTSGGGHDVRVLAWRLNTAATAATLTQTLLTGLPSVTGRHGGCRLLIASNGSLMVGTGDAATGTNPQDLTSLGGKTLRLNRTTGAPWPDNPFISSSNANQRYVLTYGHRNVQGLAQRPGGTLWSVEHGSDRDDEVNQLGGGLNYGWNPVPGYDESKPMTDHRPGRHPEQREVELGIPHGRDLGRRLGPRRQVGRLREHARGRRTQGKTRDVHALRQGGRLRGNAYADGADPVRPVAVDQQACPTGA